MIDLKNLAALMWALIRKIANRIIDLAKEHDIPIKEDPDLIEILSKVEVDQEIPPNLYKAVAEIFSFLYKITKK